MRLFITLIFIATGVCLKAQDQLFKRDNTKLEVKILEINPTEIKYKLFTYQDGPIITILKSDVAMIIYQNGVHEVINTKPEAVTAPQTLIVYKDETVRPRSRRIAEDSIRLVKYMKLTQRKNVVSINLMDFLNSSVAINYIREFKGVHVYVPLSFGFSEPYFNQPQNTIYGNNYNYFNINNFTFDKKTVEAGLGVHFHTSGKHAVTHFIGPYVGIAQFTGHFTAHYYGGYYDPYYNSNITYSAEHGFVMNRMYAMIDNGVLFRITEHFNMMLLASIGYHFDDYIANNPNKYGTYYNYSSFLSNGIPFNSVKLGFSVGYRF